MGIYTIGGNYDEIQNPSSMIQKPVKSNRSSIDIAPYIPIALIGLLLALNLYFAQVNQSTSYQPMPCPNTCDRRVDILLTQDPIVVQGGVSLRGTLKNTIDLIPLGSEVVLSTREMSAHSLKKGDMAEFNCTFDNNGRSIYGCDLLNTTITH